MIDLTHIAEEGHYAEFMRSEWFSIARHLLLFSPIFAIACTKGVPDFTKETIKRQ